MIKVRVVRGIQSGLPLLAIGGGVAGCAADQDAGATAGESNLTTAAVDPGTGSFSLSYAYNTSSGYTFTAKSSVDEYVRAGEKMTFDLHAANLWSWLYPAQPFPQDLERVKSISAKVNVSYLKNGVKYGATTVAADAWRGTTLYELTASTAAFVVDAGAETMRFGLEITDGTTTKTLGDGAFLDQAVIGGALPNKSALFDTLGAQYRGRILEGGSPVAGANLAITYTDWRAATLIDSTSLDRTIGTQKTYSRFGEVDMPLQGNIEYDITYRLLVDGQVQEEKMLTPDTASRLLPANRVAYDTSLAIPAGAKNVSISFHVKAFLRADYSGHEMSSKKYEDGARILLRETDDGSTNSFVTAAN